MALVLMNAIDWVYTANAIGFGGEEANPLMNYILGKWGLDGIWWWKFGILGVMAPILAVGHLEGRRYIRMFFYLSVVTYGLLTLYHVMWYHWMNSGYMWV